VTFEEQEEKPLDLDADLEDQIRTICPNPGAAASEIVADGDSESQHLVNPWDTSLALVRFR